MFEFCSTTKQKIGGKNGQITEAQFLEFVTKIDPEGYRRSKESDRWVDSPSALAEIWDLVHTEGGELMSVAKLQELMNTFGYT